MLRKFLLAMGFLCGALDICVAQSALIPYNRAYYHLLDRYEILRGEFVPHYPTGFKPLRRDNVAGFLDEVDQVAMGKVDEFNFRYLRNDNWEFVEEETALSQKPLWKKIYKRPSDFYYHRDKDFDVHINPVIYFRGGTESGAESTNFRNTRGITLRGSIDRKVGFYTYLTSNEVIFPTWVEDYTEHNGAVPGQGFWKRYGDHGYSYFAARGYFTFKVSKHIDAQMGHDRNFVGEGYRSMILSDFSNPYMFFKLNVNVWKLQYTTMWAQMTADIFLNSRNRPEDGRYPKKWFSLHRLGMNIGKKLNIGIFESVMANQADWTYLNPVIFYRWVEHQLGTPDKVMLGTDFKWNFAHAMQLYGQFALDEFVFGEFFGVDGKNSKRNKHGLQLGYKYINVFQIKNLDLQLEYNQARPYTYQEKFDHQAYTHYRTPIAHPRGANFREAIGILRYQPIPKLSLNFTGIYHIYGTDPDEATNMGGDLLKNRLEGEDGLGLYGHQIGQGVENKLLMGNIVASYMLKHNLFIDLGHSYRRHTAEGLDAPEVSNYSHLSLRLNIAREAYNY
ncbi:hypothetical protein [Echinicola rosea]|uniref:Capsule assembly Wzi family protein n=1 Tax=Echinicola rosea TaxID=1807691 RepID=A0ABQ1UPF0_9BACT|nr:hypothetical protein [Echinicola rosea]GGF23880.1 hypothetical protein GCM10011339_09970 [Echinicola rosea]